ncbi:hypothetical protein CA233_05910 [Sphingomonas sp. ABOLD]|nr:hypothetical protein CA234_21335 [Sphingomonas sp. ABOLE]RSV50609.1 hypothetical protein CA233_05910 [Sphingomonas sp. ABOLD]
MRLWQRATASSRTLAENHQAFLTIPSGPN